MPAEIRDVEGSCVASVFKYVVGRTYATPRRLVVGRTLATSLAEIRTQQISQRDTHTADIARHGRT